MNFLAHLYLSGEDEDILIGNFMADGIKGNKFNDYPVQIRKGILLHRFIDSFTDAHPICLASKKLLRPRYHKLSPILVDMIYDHFLTLNWAEYHHQPLREYVDWAYQTLTNRYEDLTPEIQRMLPYLIKYDWLYNYQFKEGMERVLKGMSQRVRAGEVLQYGWQDIEKYRPEFDAHFREFFPEIKSAVAKKLIQLNKEVGF